MTEPLFYTPEAETADVVRCNQGHLMLRKTPLIVGQAIHATWGCPYCVYSDAERRVATTIASVLRWGR